MKGATTDEPRPTGTEHAFGSRSEWDERDADPGWNEDGTSPAGGAGPGPRQGPDLRPFVAMLDGLRGMVPREVQGQFNALLRELLLTLRALIDWYLERLDGRPSERRVEDIPID